MHRKIIINETSHETRVALLEDGTIAELFIERGDETNIVGNIYKGRVQRVLPGIQAAFVDIGLNQAAFLYVDDVFEDRFKEFEQFILQEERDDDEVADEKPSIILSRLSHIEYQIEELISEGQEIMVQVAKSPIGTKGARVTSYISIPGRYLVLMPNSNHIGISRRISDAGERNRLKDIVLDLREGEFGYIVRTAAEGIEEDKLSSEMRFLTNLWSNIKKKYKIAPNPSPIHQELDISLRAVRDLLLDDAISLVIDASAGHQKVVSFIETYMPSLKHSIELYDGTEPIFHAYNLEGDISRALKKKVWLKSGGYIVIEHTEALVAIDVNTGRYVGKHNLEETILKTNLEAVKEIAYQVRLRDIGGIIIIDFIDMAKLSSQEKVFNELKEAFKKDRSKTHILPISEMGLIQMTRKRIKKPLNRVLCEPCLYCEGEGYLISKRSICYTIYREILREVPNMIGAKLHLKVNPEIADMLRGEENNLMIDIERITQKRIVINPNAHLHIEEFDMIEENFN